MPDVHFFRQVRAGIIHHNGLGFDSAQPTSRRTLSEAEGSKCLHQPVVFQVNIDKARTCDFQLFRHIGQIQHV